MDDGLFMLAKWVGLAINSTLQLAHMTASQVVPALPHPICPRVAKLYELQTHTSKTASWPDTKGAGIRTI
jgi:hypothetical protein